MDISLNDKDVIRYADVSCKYFKLNTEYGSKNIMVILPNVKQILLHIKVNCQFVMGGGVALALRKKWPVVYNNYVEIGKQYKKPSNEWLGTCQIVGKLIKTDMTNLFGTR